MAFLCELIDVTTSGSGLALMELNYRNEFHRACEHSTKRVKGGLCCFLTGA